MAAGHPRCTHVRSCTEAARLRGPCANARERIRPRSPVPFLAAKARAPATICPIGTSRRTKVVQKGQTAFPSPTACARQARTGDRLSPHYAESAKGTGWFRSGPVKETDSGLVPFLVFSRVRLVKDPSQDTLGQNGTLVWSPASPNKDQSSNRHCDDQTPQNEARDRISERTHPNQKAKADQEHRESKEPSPQTAY